MGSSSRNSTPRRVALLIEASRAYARGLVRGVARYSRERKWSITFTPRGLDDPPPVWLRGWQGDGILARINDRRMARAVAAKGVPVVELRRVVAAGFPSLGPDDQAVASLAVDHFRQRGFEHYGLLATPRGHHPFLDARAEHFQRLTREAGLTCRTLHVLAGGSHTAWEPELKRMIRWLRELPKPTAVLACTDDLGLMLLEACRRAKILVPDEVAVTGVGNDECLCNLASPPLTSIDLDPERIGYEAAALLDEMMAGRRRPSVQSVMPPRGMVTRMSTDVLATNDQCVVEAVRFIRAQACEAIQVPDVLRHVHRSRASLEPRFKQVLGRTIHQEIQRVQVERVKELLTNSDAPLKQVSSLAGFRYPEYMMRVFRRATGRTPGQFRKQMLFGSEGA